MSQFDQTTEKKANSHTNTSILFNPSSLTEELRFAKMHFAEGRNSTKASMEILARAVEEAQEAMHLIWIQNENHPEDGARERDRLSHEWDLKLTEIIAQVKANGDWPLEDK